MSRRREFEIALVMLAAVMLVLAAGAHAGRNVGAPSEDAILDVAAEDIVAVASLQATGVHALAMEQGVSASLLQSGSPPGITMTIVSSVGEEALAVARAGDYLIAGFGNKVSVLSTSDPANPAEVGVFEGGQSQGVNHIAARGSHAYVVDGSPGLRVLDITDPVTPTQMSYTALTSPRKMSLAVAGDYVFLGEAAHPLRPSGLRVFSVSDPSSPDEVAFFAQPNNDVADLDVVGDWLYASLWFNGEHGALAIFDIDDMSDVQRVGEYNPGGAVNATEVFSTTAYVSAEGAGEPWETTKSWSSIRVVDVGNSWEPVPLGEAYDLPVSPQMGHAPNVLDALLTETDLLLADSEYLPTTERIEGVGYHLRLIDVTGTPVELANVELPSQPYGLAYEGDFVYVAGGEAGLLVVEIDR